jgi:hypothetical protein
VGLASEWASVEWMRVLPRPYTVKMVDLEGGGRDEGPTIRARTREGWLQ